MQASHCPRHFSKEERKKEKLFCSLRVPLVLGRKWNCTSRHTYKWKYRCDNSQRVYRKSIFLCFERCGPLIRQVNGTYIKKCSWFNSTPPEQSSMQRHQLLVWASPSLLLLIDWFLRIGYSSIAVFGKVLKWISYMKIQSARRRKLLVAFITSA